MYIASQYYGITMIFVDTTATAFFDTPCDTMVNKGGYHM